MHRKAEVTVDDPSLGWADEVAPSSSPGSAEARWTLLLLTPCDLEVSLGVPTSRELRALVDRLRFIVIVVELEAAEDPYSGVPFTWRRISAKRSAKNVGQSVDTSDESRDRGKQITELR